MSLEEYIQNCGIFKYCGKKKRIYVSVKKNCDFKCNMNVYLFTLNYSLVKFEF